MDQLGILLLHHLLDKTWGLSISKPLAVALLFFFLKCHTTYSDSKYLLQFFKEGTYVIQILPGTTSTV